MIDEIDEIVVSELMLQNDDDDELVDINDVMVEADDEVQVLEADELEHLDNEILDEMVVM